MSIRIPMVSSAGTQLHQSGGVVPGWYPDPWQMAPLRYHDGSAWTPTLAPYPIDPSVGGLDPSNPSHRMLMPVGRTPLSIIAGYVGLLSVLLVPAPAALVLGICALVQLGNRPAAFGRGRAIFAIVMGGLFSAVLAAAIVAGLTNHR